MLDASFWRGRRVLVTGHTGFKGSWLALMLQKLGAHVHGMALAPDQRPSLYELLDLRATLGDEWVDVRDAATVHARVATAAPDVIFHLAAQSLVRAGYRDPIGTYATNVMGTVHLLEAARRERVRSVVVVTSDKCYQDMQSTHAYREDDRLGGGDPYSSSKACAEIVTAAYRQAFFVPADCAVATARAGNVIGGGDWSQERLVPDLIRAFVNGEPVRLRNPSAVRPWQHVLDPLTGYLMLAQRLAGDGERFAGAWNFGPDARATATVADVAQYAIDAWPGAAPWVQDGAPAPHETHFLSVDAAKSRAELGWRPRLDFEESMAWTIEWYRAWHARDDVRSCTERQLERYAEVAV